MTTTTEEPSTEDTSTDEQPAESDAETTAEPEPTEGTPEETDTFPRTYVEELRRENAEHRTKAKRADDLAQRLHVALVAATGRLADPEDLPYDEAHLDNPDALTAAIEDLVTRKPHLADRRPHGDVGQGATASDDAIDLAGMLRSRAG